MTSCMSPTLCYSVIYRKINTKQILRTVLSRNFSAETGTIQCLKRNKIKLNLSSYTHVQKRFINISSRLSTTPERHELAAGLTKQQAEELTLRLTSDERILLLSALQEFQSKNVKDEYLGQLAASRWRSKFGRPSRLPSLGDVDPTGSYCPVPEDWLRKKCAESVTPPSKKELIGICVANSIPFIGFGFLDNFVMIIAGDYIDFYVGSSLCISTMAAAALGNTFSDVLGIGSAYYVERFAEYIGFRSPKLSPIQLDMPISRHFANLGRVIGVTIGCLLGMFPLLFMSNDEEKKKPKVIEIENKQDS